MELATSLPPPPGQEETTAPPPFVAAALADMPQELAGRERLDEAAEPWVEATHLEEPHLYTYYQELKAAHPERVVEVEPGEFLIPASAAVVSAGQPVELLGSQTMDGTVFVDLRSRRIFADDRLATARHGEPSQFWRVRLSVPSVVQVESGHAGGPGGFQQVTYLVGKEEDFLRVQKEAEEQEVRRAEGERDEQARQERLAFFAEQERQEAQRAQYLREVEDIKESVIDAPFRALKGKAGELGEYLQHAKQICLYHKAAAENPDRFEESDPNYLQLLGLEEALRAHQASLPRVEERFMEALDAMATKRLSVQELRKQAKKMMDTLLPGQWRAQQDYEVQIGEINEASL